MTAQTSLGEVEAAEVTSSLALPGNGARIQREPLSRHAAGFSILAGDEVASNAHALWRPVAVTAVKLGLLLPGTVLTIFHDGGAVVAASAAAGSSAAAQAIAAAPISRRPEKL